MMFKALLLFIYISLTTVLFSCGSKSDSNRDNESVELQSYRLIDSNQEDSAIVLLTDKIAELRFAKLKRELSDPEKKQLNQLKVILASAYAKKAGITIREMVVTYQIGKQFSNLSSAFSSGQIEIKTSQDKALQSIIDIYLGQIKIFQAISAIPKVEKNNIIFIEQAVKVLQSTSNLSPGDYVYSAFIKLILARSYLESENMVNIVPKVEKNEKECIAHFDRFRQYLIKTSSVLLGCIDDLKHALPNQASDFDRVAKGITDVSTQLVALGYANHVIQEIEIQSLGSLYKAMGLSRPAVECSN